jgi:transcription termination/antitermination protein NusG
MSEKPLSPRWYALHVRSKFEDTAAFRLEDMGVRQYLPKVSTLGQTKRKDHHSSSILFPGYIFCFIDLTTGPKLYTVPGFIRIVGNGRSPIPIEDSEIELVRKLIDSALSLNPHPYLEQGSRIHIVGGALAGVSGTFLRTERSDRVVVSLPLLKRSVAVAISPQWVQPGQIERYGTG